MEAASGGRVKLVPREKGEGTNAAAYAELFGAITATGGAGVGAVSADAEKESGAMVDEVRTALGATGVAAVDAARGVEAFLAVKDEDALAQVRKAGHLASRVARDKFVVVLEAVLDDSNKAGRTNSGACVRGSGGQRGVKRGGCSQGRPCVGGRGSPTRPRHVSNPSDVSS